MVSSLAPSIPTEFASAPIETSTPAEKDEIAPKPKPTPPPKPVQAKETEAPLQLMPALPDQTPSVELHDQPGSQSEPLFDQPPNEPLVETESITTSSSEENPAQVSPPPTKEAQTPQTQLGDLVPFTEVDVPPTLLRKVEPRYPPLALTMKQEGSVTVNALITENGDVMRTEILKGIPNGSALEAAAEAAVRQWKFSPAQKDGVNVKVWRPIDIKFRLNQQLPTKE